MAILFFDFHLACQTYSLNSRSATYCYLYKLWRICRHGSVIQIEYVKSICFHIISLSVAFCSSTRVYDVRVWRHPKICNWHRLGKVSDREKESYARDKIRKYEHCFHIHKIIIIICLLESVEFVCRRAYSAHQRIHIYMWIVFLLLLFMLSGHKFRLAFLVSPLNEIHFTWKCRPGMRRFRTHCWHDYLNIYSTSTYRCPSISVELSMSKHQCRCRAWCRTKNLSP